MVNDLLITVDAEDNVIGEIAKLEGHRKGILHRAFSIFIFNPEGKWLMQQRAFNKYHSGGLWTNTCCSHPHPGQLTEEAAINRLYEEMGIWCNIQHIFEFTYKASFGNGLTEYEYDHIFTGVTDTLPEINKEEVHSYKFMSFEEIKTEVEENPDHFTEWFKIIYEKVNSCNVEKSFS